MIIKLTSVENFDKVLEILKQNVYWNDDTNFYEMHNTVPEARKDLEEGNLSWYLKFDYDWITDLDCYLKIKCFNQPDYTDEEYLNKYYE